MATGLNTSPAAPGPDVDISPAGLSLTRRWGVIITLGSFLFGFDTGIISGALLFISEDFGLNSFEQGTVVSVLLLGAMAGALCSGGIADRVGRRRTLGALGVVFIAGIAIAALATGYPMMLLGRLVMGLGVGGVSAVVPTYLSEISPTRIRGRMLTLNQLLITVGLLASYLVNLAFAGSENWRAMFWIGAIPAAALVIGIAWVPESPSWLVRRGRLDQARAALGRVTDDAGTRAVIDGYRDQEDARRREDEADGATGVGGMRRLLAPRVRPALVVALTLAVVQQFAGINTIIYYAPTIMRESGLSASNAIFYSVFIGIINLAMTVVSIRLVDRVGRRPLLLVSLAGMLVTLALLGLSFVADLDSLITLTCMLLYIVAFAIGMGPVFWVLLGEVFPARERAEGAAVGSTTNWLANFAISLAFLPLVSAIGQGETFWLFAMVCAVGVWFVGRYVPETRDRRQEEIDADLRARWGDAGPSETAAIGD